MPMGKKHSKETRKKISDAMKGKKHSAEHNRKVSESKKGKPNPKISKLLKGKTLSEQHKRNISLATRGKIKTEKTKEKISHTLKGRHLSPNTEFKKGHKINWQGGISFYPYPEDWTDDLKESIRKRDEYVCQECGIHQDELKGRLKKLDIHHINYDKDNLNPENLISLCRGCHIKTNFNRDYWIGYFKGREINNYIIVSKEER